MCAMLPSLLALWRTLAARAPSACARTSCATPSLTLSLCSLSGSSRSRRCLFFPTSSLWELCCKGADGEVESAGEPRTEPMMQGRHAQRLEKQSMWTTHSKLQRKLQRLSAQAKAHRAYTSQTTSS